MLLCSVQSLSHVRLFVTPWTVHYQLLELTQTHVHWVGVAIQPSHPPWSPFLLVLSLPQHQGLFQWVGSSHQVASIGASASASVFSMNIQGWSPLGLTGLISLRSKGLSRVFSSTTVWKYNSKSTKEGEVNTEGMNGARSARYPVELKTPGPQTAPSSALKLTI